MSVSLYTNQNQGAVSHLIFVCSLFRDFLINKLLERLVFHKSDLASDVILDQKLQIVAYDYGQHSLHYRSDPKFWANAVDPEQSDQGVHCLPLRSSLIWVYFVCHSVCMFWTHYCL